VDSLRLCLDRSPAIYDGAFSEKAGLAIPDAQRRLEIIEKGFNPEFSFLALDDGKPAGIASFKTREGSLTSGITANSLLRELGFFGGLRAIFVFSIFDRSFAERQLLLDAIAVDASMRSKGVGKALIEALKDFAIEQGYTSIRLDVVDTNPRAQQLYERIGFQVEKVESMGMLSDFLGFNAVTSMVLPLKQDAL